MAQLEEAVLGGVRTGGVPARIWLWGMAALSVGVGLYALSYVSGHAAPPGVSGNGAGYVWLRVHILCSGVALLLGPWQFFAAIRNQRPAVHRLIGRTYVCACLAGGVAGAVLAWNASEGDLARSGFGALSLIWLAVTGMAYVAIRRRDFINHRAWMIRSFSLTFAAVTLRIYLPVSLIVGASFAHAYPIIAWAAWVPNLIVAEAWLYFDRRALSV
jgi:uncharacterized membrane protein